jgi:hypothetical protein
MSQDHQQTSLSPAIESRSLFLPICRMTMKSPLFHLIIFLVAAVAANPLDSQNIQWGPCSKDGPRAAIYAQARVKIECGVLAVPIDWTSPESEPTYNISLLKVPALKGPAKGSIQFNFGGPGFGMEGLPPYAEVYQACVFLE